jgi:hypothetical protein
VLDTYVYLRRGAVINAYDGDGNQVSVTIASETTSMVRTQ